MGQNSNIEWTHHTFNPWRGCTKVSDGCKNCYAEKLSGRNPKALGVWGPSGARAIAAESYWKEPRKWNQSAKTAGEIHRVFCASLADVGEGPDTMPRDAWPLVEHARLRLAETFAPLENLVLLLLTKRPENMGKFFPAAFLQRNWVGASIENAAVLHRIDTLKSVPAAVHFLSIEPLLGPLPTLGEHLDGIDWVIVGGESGPGARPMHPDWARTIRDQCQSACVAFFFKQWGEWSPLSDHPESGGPLKNVMFWDTEFGHWQEGIRTFAYHVTRVGKHAAGRLLNGREWSEFPHTPATAGKDE